MKVAVTAAGSGIESAVHPRFGRGAWLLVVETDSGQVQAIDNSAGMDATSGAGVGAAQRVAESGAEYLLTGHCGPNAFRALGAAGVKVIVGVEGSVGEAVERLKRGELKVSDGADVGGHW